MVKSGPPPVFVKKIFLQPSPPPSHIHCLRLLSHFTGKLSASCKAENACCVALGREKCPKPYTEVWPCVTGWLIRPHPSPREQGQLPGHGGCCAVASAALCRVADAVLAALHHLGSRIWNIVPG